MIKNVTILGGGTSGLISALILKAKFNSLNIDVIKSSEIGIIGVGEGSTEHWSSFMKICGISINELIKETDATFKTGIKFVNWNGDNDYYFHSLHSAFGHEAPTGFPFIYSHMIANGYDHHDVIPKNIHESTHTEYFETSVNQFHFNTFKLNEYLLKLCRLKSINIIDAKIDDVIIDDTGHVSYLLDDSKKKYFSDFFVDCSGFKRVISTKLGAKWIDCKKYLPMNAAIAFPTERLEVIPSNTISTAMSAGWMWRIPTQGRFGNGYVYNDDFLTEGQAIAEAQSVFDQPIEIGKKIKFSAGYVDKFWIGNCVSVGLAGSFVEPLEASSIGTSIQQSISLANHLVFWEPGDTATSAQYNKEFENVCKNIIDFVQLHYVTKRKDSEFWKSCQDLTMTDFNNETLEIFKKSLPSHVFFTKPYLMFKDQNWLLVMHGLGMIDKEKIKNILNFQNDDITFAATDAIKNYKAWEENQSFVSHRQALEIIMSRSNVQKIEFDNG
jgi:tryptophan 7-halogenase